MRRITVDELLPLLERVPLIDVRTPAEFAKGRIPHAHNIPLFSDDERAVVGTTYKQVGRHSAILEGLDIVGPKMRQLVEAAQEIVGEPVETPEPTTSLDEGELPDLIVHCWRGGMRSGSVGWLYENFGWRVAVLEGGYKAYRTWALEMFERPWDLMTIGGRTGSAKTEVLHALDELGEQVVDLEGLANHRGSAFGALNLPDQPAQQTFENELALVLEGLDMERRIWVEDESRMIGYCAVPHEFMKRKGASPMVVLDVPLETRLDHLVSIYGEADLSGLAASFGAIEERLGHQRLDAALAALDDDDLRTAAYHALDYYDRAYDHGIAKRDADRVHTVETEGVDPVTTAKRLHQLAYPNDWEAPQGST